MLCGIKEFRELTKKFHIILFLKYIQQRNYFPSILSNFSFLSRLPFSTRTTQKLAVIAFSVKSLDFLLFIFLLLNWFRENFKVIA